MSCVNFHLLSERLYVNEKILFLLADWSWSDYLALEYLPTELLGGLDRQNNKIEGKI